MSVEKIKVICLSKTTVALEKQGILLYNNDKRIVIQDDEVIRAIKSRKLREIEKVKIKKKEEK